jgi:hypothetical protein
MAIPTEPNQLQLLLRLFHDFLEKINLLVTHNGSNYDFRTEISAGSSEVELAFGAFFKLASQQCATMPVLQQGLKPGIASSTSALRRSAMPFLRQWHKFAQTVFEARASGKEAIQRSVIDSLASILSGVTTVLKARPESMTVHDHTVRICRHCQQQLKSFQAQYLELTTVAFDAAVICRLAEEVKEFSRKLNEAYSREFVSGGLPLPDLALLKTQAFGSCSDVIHGITASIMFDTDVRQVIDSFDRFQELLGVVLERLNLPQSYLFERGESGRELTPRSEEEAEPDEEGEEFADDTPDFLDLISRGAELARDEKKFHDWARAVTQRATHLIKQCDDACQKIRAVEGSMEQCVRNYEQMLETERSTNSSISAEIQRLQDAVYERDREIVNLRQREEDNEFKRCLRDIAKQLGGVVKEESINFHDDEDDDQLIQYVNALSVYVVEKKCPRCEEYAAREASFRELFEVMAPGPVDDITTLGESARRVWNEAVGNSMRQRQEIDVLRQSVKDLENVDRKILAALKVPENGGNIGEVLLKAIEDFFQTHNSQVETLTNEKVMAIEYFSAEMLAKVRPFLHEDERNRPPAGTIDILVDTHQHLLLDLADMTDACKQTISRVARFLHVVPPDMESVPKATLLVLETLERTRNPLEPVLLALEDKYRETIGSVVILANRMRGIASLDNSTDLNQLPPPQITALSLELLDCIHDKFEMLQNESIKQNDDIRHLRGCVESLDLKMHRFLNLENCDLNQFSIEQLIQRVLKFGDMITQPSVSNDFVPVPELNKIFKGVAGVSSLSDPRRYLPEVAGSMVVFENSIAMLRPFMTILNEALAVLESSQSVVKPESREFGVMQKKELELHAILKSLAPAKVNVSLIAAIQKFTSFISALLKGIAKGAVAEAFITRETP